MGEPTKRINIFIILHILIVWNALIVIATDCTGKPFHCETTSYFKICVDFGNGASFTIDDFLIPCPPGTECKPTNHFECELIEDNIQTTLQPSVVTTSERVTVKNISASNVLWETVVDSNVVTEKDERYVNTVMTTYSTSSDTFSFGYTKTSNGDDNNADFNLNKGSLSTKSNTALLSTPNSTIYLHTNNYSDDSFIANSTDDETSRSTNFSKATFNNFVEAHTKQLVTDNIAKESTPSYDISPYWTESSSSTILEMAETKITEKIHTEPIVFDEKEVTQSYSTSITPLSYPDTIKTTQFSSSSTGYSSGYTSVEIQSLSDIVSTEPTTREVNTLPLESQNRIPYIELSNNWTFTTEPGQLDTTTDKSSVTGDYIEMTTVLTPTTEKTTSFHDSKIQPNFIALTSVIETTQDVNTEQVKYTQVEKSTSSLTTSFILPAEDLIQFTSTPDSIDGLSTEGATDKSYYSTTIGRKNIEENMETSSVFPMTQNAIDINQINTNIPKKIEKDLEKVDIDLPSTTQTENGLIIESNQNNYENPNTYYTVSKITTNDIEVTQNSQMDNLETLSSLTTNSISHTNSNPAKYDEDSSTNTEYFFGKTTQMYDNLLPWTQVAEYFTEPQKKHITPSTGDNIFNYFTTINYDATSISNLDPYDNYDYHTKDQRTEPTKKTTTDKTDPTKPACATENKVLEMPMYTNMILTLNSEKTFAKSDRDSGKTTETYENIPKMFETQVTTSDFTTDTQKNYDSFTTSNKQLDYSTISSNPVLLDSKSDSSDKNYDGIHTGTFGKSTKKTIETYQPTVVNKILQASTPSQNVVLDSKTIDSEIQASFNFNKSSQENASGKTTANVISKTKSQQILNETENSRDDSSSFATFDFNVVSERATTNINLQTKLIKPNSEHQQTSFTKPTNLVSLDSIQKTKPSSHLFVDSTTPKMVIDSTNSYPILKNDETTTSWTKHVETGKLFTEKVNIVSQNNVEHDLQSKRKVNYLPTYPILNYTHDEVQNKTSVTKIEGLLQGQFTFGKTSKATSDNIDKSQKTKHVNDGTVTITTQPYADVDHSRIKEQVSRDKFVNTVEDEKFGITGPSIINSLATKKLLKTSQSQGLLTLNSNDAVFQITSEGKFYLEPDEHAKSTVAMNSLNINYIKKNDAVISPKRHIGSKIIFDAPVTFAPVQESSKVLQVSTHKKNSSINAGTIDSSFIKDSASSTESGIKTSTVKFPSINTNKPERNTVSNTEIDDFIDLKINKTSDATSITNIKIIKTEESTPEKDKLNYTHDVYAMSLGSSINNVPTTQKYTLMIPTSIDISSTKVSTPISLTTEKNDVLSGDSSQYSEEDTIKKVDIIKKENATIAESSDEVNNRLSVAMYVINRTPINATSHPKSWISNPTSKTNSVEHTFQASVTPRIVNSRKSTSDSFVCSDRVKGRYSDPHSCQRFYVCIGRHEPIECTCPGDTVFSEIDKKCTKKPSHCIRNSQFMCTKVGRFPDYHKKNVYYVCTQNGKKFVRFTYKCMNDYYLDDSVHCIKNKKGNKHKKRHEALEKSSGSDSKENVHETKRKFSCQEEGKFPDPNHCRYYYVCRQKKSHFHQKRKKCDDDEIFDKDKKKCIEASHECQ